MTEPYTDEDIRSGKVNLMLEDPGPANLLRMREFMLRVWATFQHLIDERDEARRVAQVPAEPKCKVCGEPQSFEDHYTSGELRHAFEPEAPDDKPFTDPYMRIGQLEAQTRTLAKENSALQKRAEAAQVSLYPLTQSVDFNGRAAGPGRYVVLQRLRAPAALEFERWELEDRRDLQAVLGMMGAHPEWGNAVIVWEDSPEGRTFVGIVEYSR